MKRWMGLGIIVLTLLVCSNFLPPSIDWESIYMPATRSLLAGENPYVRHHILVPPWVWGLLIPFAVLPTDWSLRLFFIFNFGAFVFVAHYWGAKLHTLVAFLLSPMVLVALMVSSFESLVLIGFCLPPALGLFLVLIKPQVGMGMVVYWLIVNWRKGGWRKTVRVFAPVTIIGLLSFVFFGWWLGRWGEAPGIMGNTSMWPLLLPVGLALLVRVWQTHDARYAFPMAACLSPYLSSQSWVPVFLALLQNRAVMIAAVVGVWVVALVRFLMGSG